MVRSVQRIIVSPLNQAVWNRPFARTKETSQEEPLFLHLLDPLYPLELLHLLSSPISFIFPLSSLSAPSSLLISLHLLRALLAACCNSLSAYAASPHLIG